MGSSSMPYFIAAYILCRIFFLKTACSKSSTGVPTFSLLVLRLINLTKNRLYQGQSATANKNIRVK